jgi:hypothetical protein
LNAGYIVEKAQMEARIGGGGNFLRDNAKDAEAFAVAFQHYTGAEQAG